MNQNWYPNIDIPVTSIESTQPYYSEPDSCYSYNQMSHHQQQFFTNSVYNSNNIHSQSCPSIDYSTTPQLALQISTESSPSPPSQESNSMRSSPKFAPVRKLTRASSIPSNCSTPKYMNSNPYHYPSTQLTIPNYNPILELRHQDPTKPLYEGQKRGRKPKADNIDEEKKLTKRIYGRHYRKNKNLEALKVQEKFKTTKIYMDSIKEWAVNVGCNELVALVNNHEKLMTEIDNFTDL